MNMTEGEFQEFLFRKGHELFRSMPWRDDTRPYYVFVSELMLQQTQVTRVIPKFNTFIERFPSEQELAVASLADVLTAWQGLGYNRRAKFLHDSAKLIVSQFDGVFPTTPKDILSLPGIGKNTRGAIEAYAFNRPVVFIETNIRTVYMHHFFEDATDIPDSDIMDCVNRTLDYEHPREFYWALMDYGSWLKANGTKNNSQSASYKKQSPLQGSVRQVRGQIITVLAKQPMDREMLAAAISADERFDVALNGVIVDGLVVETNRLLHLTN